MSRTLLDTIKRHAEIPDAYAWASLGITVPEARTLLAYIERASAERVAHLKEIEAAEARGYAKAVGDYRAGGGDAEVEQARAAGYALAVQRLRDDERYEHWWTARAYAPEDRYWEPAPRNHLADYLETVERPLPGEQGGSVPRA
jgi:hypothetical protein